MISSAEATSAPVCDLDLFSDAAILDPYPLYRTIRDLGPVVWLRRHGFYVLSRYADVRSALLDWQRFSSAQGVGFNDAMNDSAGKTMIASDPPHHDALRKMIAPPLFPGALKAAAPLIEAEAEALADRLAARGSFDGVADLAWHLPTTVVTKLVGLPEAGREKMTEWGVAGFDAGGPADSPRTAAALPVIFDMLGYIMNPELPDKVQPGSWAARVFEVAAQGGVPVQQAAALLIDYVAPSLDTTVSAMSSALWCLARDPALWAAIRADTGLIAGAMIEAIRLESPIRMLARVATQDVDVDGCVIPQGARVAMLYGSANRDERKWPEPDRFLLERLPHDHVGFGYGPHSCMGMHLAKLEISAVLKALAARVERIEVGEPVRLMSNTLRSMTNLPVNVLKAT